MNLPIALPASPSRILRRASRRSSILKFQPRFSSSETPGNPPTDNTQQGAVISGALVTNMFLLDARKPSAARWSISLRAWAFEIVHVGTLPPISATVSLTTSLMSGPCGLMCFNVRANLSTCCFSSFARPVALVGDFSAAGRVAGRPAGAPDAERINATTAAAMMSFLDSGFTGRCSLYTSCSRHHSVRRTLATQFSVKVIPPNVERATLP